MYEFMLTRTACVWRNVETRVDSISTHTKINDQHKLAFQLNYIFKNLNNRSHIEKGSEGLRDVHIVRD
jgi:hypothetical protein